MTTPDSTFWYLENFDFFNLFCPAKMKNHDFSSETPYKKNDYIYLSNEPAKYIYLLESGRIKIGSYSEDGKEIIKAVLEPGEVFGEMAIVGEEIRSEFAQALDENVKVCQLSLEDVQQLMKEDVEFATKITKLIGFRLRRMERKLESLIFKDARTRIIDYLKDLAIERGKKVGFEILVKNFFTHEDIGKMTATSRQTVTSVLNELKSKNLITFDRRRLLIRDLENLK